jgi:hypothetical protein
VVYLLACCCPCTHSFSKEFWDKVNRGEMIVELGPNANRSAGVMSKLIAKAWHELDEKGQRPYAKVRWSSLHRAPLLILVCVRTCMRAV